MVAIASAVAMDPSSERHATPVVATPAKAKKRAVGKLRSTAIWMDTIPASIAMIAIRAFIQVPLILAMKSTRIVMGTMAAQQQATPERLQPTRGAARMPGAVTPAPETMLEPVWTKSQEAVAAARAGALPLAPRRCLWCCSVFFVAEDLHGSDRLTVDA